jgi:hypothetical protein
MKHCPSTLKEIGKKYWAQFLTDMDPETPIEWDLLETICKLKDHIDACEQAIDNFGYYANTEKGTVQNPAVKDLLRFTSLYLKAMRELKPKGPMGRPSTIPEGARKRSNVR